MFASVLIIHIFCLPLGGDEDILFSEKIIKEYFGAWTGLPRSVYYMGVLSLGLDTINVNFCFIYVCVHLKLQFILLTELLKKLSGYHKPDMEDIFYQEIVRKRLKFCVKLHNTLKK